MEQWVCLTDDGATVSRTAISKPGSTTAEVTERFAHGP